MIMKIQIIGLPASGKSFLIKKYLKSRDVKNIRHLDVADYKDAKQKKQKDSTYNQRSFRKCIQNSSDNLIAESACGVYCPGTEVIKLVIDETIRREQFRKRDKQEVDIHYDSLLETTMIPATYTVTTEKALFDILDTLLQRH